MVQHRIGLEEWVFINGLRFRARIDTGARSSSLDSAIAKRLSLKKVRSVTIKSASGTSFRPVVKANVRLMGTDGIASFTIVNRNHLSFPVLIGRNVLRRGFLIDTRIISVNKHGSQ